jgi:hypothetical protein
MSSKKSAYVIEKNTWSRARRRQILYTAKHALKVILRDRETRSTQNIATRCWILFWALVYIRNIYRSSSTSKVNFVYDKTRVKSDFTRSQDATAYPWYWNIYRYSGTVKVNPVYGKTGVKSDYTRSRDAKMKSGALILDADCNIYIDLWARRKWILFTAKHVLKVMLPNCETRSTQKLLGVIRGQRRVGLTGRKAVGLDDLVYKEFGCVEGESCIRHNTC